jgi:5'-nucleotidase
VTNDDGIYSPGLRAAAEAVAPLGDLFIAAPRVQQTAMSRALPKTPEIGVIEKVTLNITGIPHLAYGITGSPALAVAYALSELAPRKPDLCVSGVNYGENVGTSISVSGTIGAAFEAAAQFIPCIAVSLETDRSMHYADQYGEVHWEVANHFTYLFAERILKQGLPPQISLLNVNIPSDATTDTPTRITRQSKQGYYVFLEQAQRDFSQPYNLRYDVVIDKTHLEPDSDIQGFVYDRVVSVTPLTIDFTAKIPLEEWYGKFMENSNKPD